jgi:hypothetical protein
MEITISVSEKTEQIIREKAEQNGKDIADFVGEFVEENFAVENSEKRERKHNLLKFAGMFSGGDGKTSMNYKKILLEEVDKTAGFTTDKEKE